MAKGKTLGFLQSYFDESGIHRGAKHCVFAGYVAGARVWDRMTRDWCAVLEEFGVSDFHSKQLFDGRGDFVAWPQERRVALLEKLLSLVASSNVHGIGAATKVADFDSYPKGLRRFLTGASYSREQWTGSGKPSASYFAAFPFAVAIAASYGSPGTPLHCICDEQRLYRGYALDYYDEIKQRDSKIGASLFSITYASRKSMPMLGLADLLAHFTAQYLDGVLSPLQEKCLTLMRNKMQPDEMPLLDAASFERVMARFLSPELRSELSRED